MTYLEPDAPEAGPHTTLVALLILAMAATVLLVTSCAGPTSPPVPAFADSSPLTMTGGPGRALVQLSGTVAESSSAGTIWAGQVLVAAAPSTTWLYPAGRRSAAILQAAGPDYRPDTTIRSATP